MTARTLLRLLLLHDRLETADDWDGALEEEGQLHGDATDMDDEQEARRRRALRIVGAIGDVVPHLPNYSAVSTKLTALMHYGEKVDAGQLHQLVQQWLQQSHRTLFRKWLVCDWLQCSQLTITAGDAEELVQWRHALVVATLHEVVKSLKWTLLRILHAVNEAMETRCTDDRDAKGTIDTSTAASMQAIGTVEELLDFCFLRAEQLASYSLLCAAKLHALAVKTQQRSATKLVEDEEVLVRLRWAFMLKPMLFRPLLQHAIALRTIAEKSAAHHVRTSTALSGLVNLVDATSRATILLEMRAMGNELDRAFARGAKHIRRLVLTSCRAAIESAVREYVQTLSNGAKERLLAELERDLDEAPPHLFPHIFIYLSLLLGATLSPRVPDHQNPVTFRAVSILLSLFDRRGHDVDSCQDVLGQLLHLALADNPMWLDEQNSSLYIETIARLSETATIQVEPQKLTWVVTMALHYLIFECDVKLLHRHQATLTQCVPQRTVRLVNIRLGNC